MYERAEDVLRLCLMLQASRQGVSLQEIQDEFHVSRRTAERLRDAVLRALPQAEEAPATDRIKRWRLPPATLNRVIGVTMIELKELYLAADRLRADGLASRAAVLDVLATKVRAQLPSRTLASVEPDLELMLESSGHAMRPGPHPRIDGALLDTLRDAILSSRTIRLRYRKRADLQVAEAVVEPHGVLFGHRHYLVAFRSDLGTADPALYSLANILDASLGPDVFVRRPEFDLHDYASRTFGVFQEPPANVVWRFSPRLADDAMEHRFHPSERKTLLPDGSLEVRFTAGGFREMAWHLFTWGSDVEIVSPPELRDLYATMLREAAALQDA